MGIPGSGSPAPVLKCPKNAHEFHLVDSTITVSLVGRIGQGKEEFLIAAARLEIILRIIEGRGVFLRWIIANGYQKTDLAVDTSFNAVQKDLHRRRVLLRRLVCLGCGRLFSVKETVCLVNLPDVLPPDFIDGVLS